MNIVRKIREDRVRECIRDIYFVEEDPLSVDIEVIVKLRAGNEIKTVIPRVYCDEKRLSDLEGVLRNMVRSAGVY